MKFGQFRNNQGTPFHSSGYAKAANGDAMGVTSSQSFQERQNIERNRQAVGRYGASYVAQGNHLQSGLRKRLESPQQQDDPDPDQKGQNHTRRTTFQSYGTRETPSVPNRQAGPGAKKMQMPERRASFREPPARGYNPYG